MEEDVDGGGGWGEGVGGAQSAHKNQCKHHTRYKVTSSTMLCLDAAVTRLFMLLSVLVNRG